MDATPRLNLPYIAPQQAPKQVTYNEAMRALDLLVQPAVKSRGLTAPPGGPAEGDAYIVAPGGTGAWAGKDGRIASLIDGAWHFVVPANGWLSYVEDSAELVIRQSGDWAPFVTNGGSSVAKFGINAGADLSNRLVVAADASLFNHNGSDHRLKLNKQASGNTASVLFQTGFSGRAEFGLAGDDDFHIKVSPDGGSWFEALTLGRASGLVTLPQGQLAFPAAQNASADPHVLDDYEEGAWTPAISFGGAAVGVTYAGGTSGRYTKVGRLCTASGCLLLSSKGSSSGVALLTGLPFASPGGSIRTACSIGYAGDMTGISGAVIGVVDAGGSSIALYQSNNGAPAALNSGNFSNTSQLHFSLSYDCA